MQLLERKSPKLRKCRKSSLLKSKSIKRSRKMVSLRTCFLKVHLLSTSLTNSTTISRSSAVTCLTSLNSSVSRPIVAKSARSSTLRNLSGYQCLSRTNNRSKTLRDARLSKTEIIRNSLMRRKLESTSLNFMLRACKLSSRARRVLH